MSDPDSILERLKHPEQEAQRKRAKQGLFLRNLLNTAFILLAVAAMIGIVICPAGSKWLMIWYGVGLFAVLLKMVEAVLRMSSLTRRRQ